MTQLRSCTGGGDASGRLRFAALMACHNRRDLTLRCLASLTAAAEVASDLAVVDTFLVDDGCTDGTGETVRVTYPRVHVIKGSGQLFWCGGMRLAWTQAATHNYDAYLWLNDDVALDADAIKRLHELSQECRRNDGAVIVVGATRVEGSEDAATVVSYGAFGAKGVLPPVHRATRVELFNGNIVLVSRRAFEVIGGLSPAYTHGLGDIDYGVRAKRAGVPAWLAAETLGSCAANKVARWRQRDLSVWKRLRELHRPTGCPPWQLARLVWRNGGWWFPWSVAKLYLQALFPGASQERP
jgi:GT2 family glycosyltransferase